MKPTSDINGTSLQGEVRTTRDKLVAAFGEPNLPGDDYKVSTEWGILFEDGTVATIYDYKETSRYDPSYPDELDPSFDDWHVGGFSQAAVKHVHEALRKAVGE